MLQLVSGKASEERPKPFYFLPESKAIEREPSIAE